MSTLQGGPSVPDGRVESIQVSRGGVPKLRIEGPVEITARGVAGDRQANRLIHGGPDRAVCLFSDEIIASLRDQGHPIDRGTTGENLTLSGIEWPRLTESARLRFGTVEIEITKAANPCRNIAGSFSDGDFNRISAKLHPGRARLYARVLTPGSVRAGDAVTLLVPDRPDRMSSAAPREMSSRSDNAPE